MPKKKSATTTIRLLFADDGTFHSEKVTVPSAAVAEYERLVDLIREEPDVTRQIYVDMRRLVSASVVDE